MENNMVTREFLAWPKIPRLNRECIITEKIDGTNAAVVFTEGGDAYAQSRNRIITPEDDNYGFASWLFNHQDELREQLGVGRHFGEWWGSGIQGPYNDHMTDKRFSLFDTRRWTGSIEDWKCVQAPLCYVVPTLSIMERFDTRIVDEMVYLLQNNGSRACPGARAEGLVVYHRQANQSFKVTLENDDVYKGNEHG